MYNERFRTIEEIRKEIGIPLRSLRLIGARRSVTVAASITFGFFLIVVVSLVIIPWVQTVQGRGRVVAFSPQDRQQILQAPVEGRIARWHVSEGSVVRVGDLIVELEDIDANLLERVQQERDAALHKMNATKLAFDASQKNVQRQKVLFDKGLSSRRAYEMAEIEAAKLASDIATVTAELARIETKFARQSSQRVTAQRGGIIQSIAAPQGGVIVRQGDLLAVVVPDTNERVVELWIDGVDLPLITPGRPVRLQFEGWPAVQFSGWPAVAVGTFGGRVSVIDPSDDGNGRFRILVVPDENEQWPEPRFLRQGVRAVGWVMLDTVRLGWELWRRFNAFPVNSTIAPPGVSSAVQKEKSTTKK